MDYRKFGDTVYVRMDRDDEIIAGQDGSTRTMVSDVRTSTWTTTSEEKS